jgi:regulatory protein
MEIIKNAEVIRGKTKIVFESGWTVWLDRRWMPGFSLDPGTAVERADFEKFLLLHQYPSALNDAVTLLAVRNRSRLEIRQSLLRRKYDHAVIEMVLFKLEKEKLMNDEEFSAQWVQARMSKYGPIRIARELRMKGIDRDMTGSAIQEVLTEDQELENAVLLAMKKLRTEKTDAEEIKRLQRITSFLVRRGYSWEIARKAYEMALERNQGEDG